MLKSCSCGTVFDLAAKKEEILKLEHETVQPNFWNDPAKAAEVTSSIAELKEEIGAWDALLSEVGELKELIAVVGEDASMQEEIRKKAEDLAARFAKAESAIYFSGRYDKGNATLSIYAGAGGEDAEDWARILLRMYTRYCESRKWQMIELHKHENEQGGIKNVSFEVKGRLAYGYLKGEQGVHRMVRVSPFSAKKLRHTSFAYIEVLPEIDDVGEIVLRPEDLDIGFARSSGPGGQNVNKRETAVRVTHIPTGVTVQVETERSQGQNKERALAMLRGKLYQLLLRSHKEQIDQLKGGKISIEWGNQIRSYVFHPYQMIKDHRTGVETAKVDNVLDGDLEEFIEAELRFNS